MGEKKDEKKVKVKPRRVEVQYGPVDDEITLQLSVYAEGAEEPTHQDTLEVEISGVSGDLVPVYIEDRIIMVMDDSGLYEESKGDEADEESKVYDEIRSLVALCRQMLDRAARYPTRRIAVEYDGTGPENLGVAILFYDIGMHGPRWQSTVLLSELEHSTSETRTTIFERAIQPMFRYIESDDAPELMMFGPGLQQGLHQIELDDRCVFTRDVIKQAEALLRKPHPMLSNP